MSESGFVEVNGNKVWFERIGSGPHVILLIPGPIGTTRSDFEELIDHEDELDFDKFTVIAVDPPGHGKSRPPQRKYGKDVYNIDIECYHTLMQDQGVNKYTVLGWDEGAKVALLMAIRYPTEVEALVLIGITSNYNNKNLKALKELQSLDKWPKNRIQNYLRGYDSKEDIQKQWNRYLQFVEYYDKYFPGDMILSQNLKAIEIPTLFVHGDKDSIISLDQTQAISKKMPYVKFHQFPNGEHDCHQKYSPQMRKLVQNFVINKEDVIKEALAMRLKDLDVKPAQQDSNNNENAIQVN